MDQVSRNKNSKKIYKGFLLNSKISKSGLPVSISLGIMNCNIFLENPWYLSPCPIICIHSSEVTISYLFCSWQTHIIQDCGHRWNVISFSGLCYCDRSACRSFCSFCVCVWCHSVCGSVKKDKGQGFEIRTPVPSFFSRNFPWHIYLEVVTLYTKLTVIGEYNKEQRG